MRKRSVDTKKKRKWTDVILPNHIHAAERKGQKEGFIRQLREARRVLGNYQWRTIYNAYAHRFERGFEAPSLEVWRRMEKQLSREAKEAGRDVSVSMIETVYAYLKDTYRRMR